MPSPSCQIPTAVVPSDILLALPNNDGQAYLPTSIPAGQSVTSEGFALVLLATPTIDPRSRAPYTATEDVSIQATVPWLDRQLKNFEVRKTICVQYPVELRECQGLASLAQGMKTEISWQVRELRFGARWPCKH